MKENNKDKANKLLQDFAFNIHKDYIEKEQRYFKLLAEVNKTTKYNEIYSKNMFEIQMVDQLEILELVTKVNKKAKEICEKYNLIEEEY